MYIKLTSDTRDNPLELFIFRCVNCLHVAIENVAISGSSSVREGERDDPAVSVERAHTKFQDLTWKGQTRTEFGWRENDKLSLFCVVENVFDRNKVRVFWMNSKFDDIWTRIERITTDTSDILANFDIDHIITTFEELAVQNFDPVWESYIRA